MDTPICDFVREYNDSGFVRFHMPGHKGTPVLGAESLDITEIKGADVLYRPQGIIRKSEQNAEKLFGTARTVYSTEGSSLAIRAMLFLTLQYARQKGAKPVIFAARNPHKTFITAAALLGIEVKWLWGEGLSPLSCVFSAGELEKTLDKSDEKPTAVYLTSPDYIGNIADIKAFSEVCRKNGVLLLVDNAHGAYLKFLPEDLHPITLGADVCCDSAHKTLPVLTGGAYLHISRFAPELFKNTADRAADIFASTSPSYLILQSLDRANAFLDGGFREKLAETVRCTDELKRKLRERGFILSGEEPLKITLMPKSYGYTGDELAEILRNAQIEPEFSDPDYLVLMVSVMTDVSVFGRLERVFYGLEKRAEIRQTPPRLPGPEQKMPPQEALFSATERITADKAVGRVLADPCVSCPPAVPILMCGEVIDSAAAELFKYYGTDNLLVVKE